METRLGGVAMTTRQRTEVGSLRKLGKLFFFFYIHFFLGRPSVPRAAPPRIRSCHRTRSRGEAPVSASSRFQVVNTTETTLTIRTTRGIGSKLITPPPPSSPGGKEREQSPTGDPASQRPPALGVRPKAPIPPHSPGLSINQSPDLGISTFYSIIFPKLDSPRRLPLRDSGGQTDPNQNQTCN